MKKRIFILSLSLFVTLIGCKKEGENKEIQNSDTIAKKDSVTSKTNKIIKLTQMTFDEPEFDFGTINQGEKVEHVFKFTNTGQNNLVISKAYSSCGCTVADYPKAPIRPGESSKIKVVFDSSGKRNKNSKTITIEANIKEKSKKLKIRINIKAPNNQKEEYKFKKNK